MFRFILRKIAEEKIFKITHMVNIHISMGRSRIAHFHIVQMRRNDLLRHIVQFDTVAEQWLPFTILKKKKCKISSGF